MSIKENLEKIRKEIDRKDVVVVGISKTFGIERIREAVKYGLRDIGENLIQEARSSS